MNNPESSAPKPDPTYEMGKIQFFDSFVLEKSELVRGKDEDEQEKLLIRLKREAGIIYDEALRYFAESGQTTNEKAEPTDFLVSIVQLPEPRADEITARILEAERAYSPEVSAEGYRAGTASKADDLEVIGGTEPTLITAEHATDHIRDDRAKEGDWGTGGFTKILATDHGTWAITPIGKQTGDANYDPEHPIKAEAGLIIAQQGIKLAMTIHAIGGGKFLTESKKDLGVSADMAIGIGSKPTDASTEFAEWLHDKAREFGLKADINPWYLTFDSEGEIKTKDMLPLRNSFTASKGRTTRASYQARATEAGLIIPIAQLELGPDLRVGPHANPIPVKILMAYTLLSEAIAKFGTEAGKTS